MKKKPFDFVINQTLLEGSQLDRIEKYDQELRNVADELKLDLCNADDFKVVTVEVDNRTAARKEKEEKRSRDIFNKIRLGQEERVFN